MSTLKGARAPHRRGTYRPEINVEVSCNQRHLAIDRSALGELVERVLRGEGIVRADLSVAVVDNETIHRINREYLDHDWPTDVISFLLSDAGAPELVGEVVVSAEMACGTAAELQADPAAELALYLVHGLLHLCSYDDSSESEVRRMRQREDEVLRREGLPNTFALVSRHKPDRPGREQAPCSV
jgi:probable rRNA maturation factor